MEAGWGQFVFREGGGKGQIAGAKILKNLRVSPGTNYSNFSSSSKTAKEKSGLRQQVTLLKKHGEPPYTSPYQD